MTALQVSGVSYRIGEATILEDVSCHVETGELVALIGPNGAGKSTLLAAATGDLDLAAGSVRLFGDDIDHLSPSVQSRRRAVQVQDTSVRYSYFVREVVAMGRWPWRGTEFEADDEAAIQEGLESADVTGLTRREVTTLSGGERARTAFARLHAQQSRLLLADEPTAALDIGHQEVVLRELLRLSRAGAAVMTVLHDLNLAAAYADRIVLIHAGRVEADGPPKDVLTSERLSIVYQTPLEVIANPRDGLPIILPIRTP